VSQVAGIKADGFEISKERSQLIPPGYQISELAQSSKTARIASESNNGAIDGTMTRESRLMQDKSRRGKRAGRKETAQEVNRKRGAAEAHN